MRRSAIVTGIILLLTAASAFTAPAKRVKPLWWPGERPTPRASGSISGVATALTATTFTIQTQHNGAPIFTINDKTKVNGTKKSIADVQAGDEVTVSYTTLRDGNVWASVITVGPVAPPKPPKKVNSASGKVNAIDRNSITIQTAKNGPQSFGITAKTKVNVYGKKATLDQIKVGDTVNVVFNVLADGSCVASSISIPIPSFNGKVTSSSSDGFEISTKAGAVQFKVNDKTKIMTHTYDGTTTDLKKGYAVNVRAVPDGSNLIALKVVFSPPEIRGTIVSVADSGIVVKTIRQRTANVTISSGTVILVRPRTAPNYRGKIDDVKAGTPVNIGGHITGKDAMAALWIDLLVP